MKRFLLSIVAIAITSLCCAQDIIVQKDGSTIQAKVLKVSPSEVEYKKFNNLDGPTYSISTKDLQCINYQNGTKDTFVSPNYNPNIVTNETATQFSNDQQLLNMYKAEKTSLEKKGKKIKNTGLIAGGILVLGGAALLAAGEFDFDDSNIGLCAPGLVLAGSGLIGGIITNIVGNSMQNKAKNQSFISSTIYQQEFKIGNNDCLMVGVDMLKDNIHKNQTLGLGLSYNF